MFENMKDLKALIEALAKVGYEVFEHRPSGKYRGGLELEIVKKSSFVKEGRNEV
jgi:hypothetical protein